MSRTGKKIDESQLSHTKWNCMYHIIFIPKYRRKSIYGKLRRDIGVYLRRLCDYKDRGTCLHGSHSYVDKNSTQTKCITVYGIFKGKKCIDDF